MRNVTNLSLIVLCGLSLPLQAQQTGSPDRDYTINLNGFAQTSPVATILNTGAPAPLGTASFFNRYDTNDPGQPVIWAMSNGVQIGWMSSPFNSIDLSPLGFQVLIDGTILSTLSLWHRTDANGKFHVSLPVLGINNGGTKAFAMAHTSPSSPEGYYVSQTHEVFFDTTSSLAAGSHAQSGAASFVNTGNDGCVVRNLGFNFDFFGTTYNQVYVCANGFVTFGAPDTSWSPSVSNLVLGPPRVAGLWADLDPGSSGISIRTTSSPAGGSTAKILWSGAPLYQGQGADATFAITLKENGIGTGQGTTGSVRLDYGPVSITEGMVAVANGSGVIFGNQLINWTQGSNALTGSQIYETFDASNPFDMAYKRTIVNLNINGYPTLQY